MKNNYVKQILDHVIFVFKSAQWADLLSRRVQELCSAMQQLNYRKSLKDPWVLLFFKGLKCGSHLRAGFINRNDPIFFLKCPNDTEYEPQIWYFIIKASSMQWRRRKVLKIGDTTIFCPTDRELSCCKFFIVSLLPHI